MNKRKIGKLGITIILGLLSAISGYVAATLVKENMYPAPAGDMEEDPDEESGEAS